MLIARSEISQSFPASISFHFLLDTSGGWEFLDEGRTATDLMKQFTEPPRLIPHKIATSLRTRYWHIIAVLLPNMPDSLRSQFQTNQLKPQIEEFSLALNLCNLAVSSAKIVCQNLVVHVVQSLQFFGCERNQSRKSACVCFISRGSHRVIIFNYCIPALAVNLFCNLIDLQRPSG